MGFVLVLKCIEKGWYITYMQRERMVYHIHVTFSRIMGQWKFLTSLCLRFIICEKEKVMPTSNIKLFHAG